MRIAQLISCVLATCAFAACGDTLTWSGGATGAFSDTTWTIGGAPAGRGPVAGDRLVIPADTKVTAAAEIRKLLPKGVDRVIVTSPPKTAPMAFDMVKFGGIVELLGIDFSGHNTIELDVNRVVFNRIDVKGVIAEPAMHFNTSLALLKSGAVDPAMFLHVCDGIDEFSAALRGVLERTIGANKVCLKIG